ncbi:MAG TPA: hypothetical protein VMF10_13580, partial [Candidatus Aquilonibacter sp.]|nr:hypothetical protein [Candidatus Aquilonibacter sp.]
GDDLVDTTIKSNGSLAESDAIDAQAFVRDGHRKLVLINERNREVTVELPNECVGAAMETIGGASPDVVKQKVRESKVSLLPLSVSVVALNE